MKATKKNPAVNKYNNKERNTFAIYRKWLDTEHLLEVSGIGYRLGCVSLTNLYLHFVLIRVVQKEAEFVSYDIE